MNYATMQLGSIAEHFEALSLGTNGRWKRLMVAFNPGIKIISRAHRSLRGFWLIGTITTDGLGRAGFVESAGKHRQSCCFGPGCDNFMNCMWMWRYARTGRVNGGQKLCTGCSGGEKRNKRGFQGSDVRFQPSVPVPGSRNWATSEGAKELRSFFNETRLILLIRETLLAQVEANRNRRRETRTKHEMKLA